MTSRRGCLCRKFIVNTTPFSENFVKEINVNRSVLRKGWEIDPFVYRIGEGPLSHAPSILQAVCEERGWKEYGPEEEKIFNGNLLGWNLWWKTIFSNVPQRSLYSWQFVNFIPRAIGFCNKEYLAHYIGFMQNSYGSIFDFCPTTFVLPDDFWKLDSEHSRRSQLNKRSILCWDERAKNLIPAEPGLNELERFELDRACVTKNFQPIWISKPIGKSQGKGIIVINDTSSLTLCDNSSVVQEYIARPLLIAGHKFDLRLYVLIPSITPLTVYVYNEGLTRFAVEKYDLKNLTSNFSHLTNATLNKMSPEYSRDKDCLGVGCKWTFQKLRQHLQGENRPDWFMWQRIISIIVLTLVGESSKIVGLVPNMKNGFEFLGYDILVDEDLRPWLLEVNHSPGLNADCEVDNFVKKPLLHDLFNLVGLPNHGPKKQKVINFPLDVIIKTPPGSTRPNTVGSTDAKDAVAMLQKLCRNKEIEQEQVSRKTLRSRLLDLAAIYSQNLTSVKLKPKRQPKKLPNSGIGVEKEENESISSTSKRKLRMRDWIHPIKKCGGWVRVFPFDELSYEHSRGKIALDTKLLVNHIYCNLKKAREITLDKVIQTDEIYADYLKVANKVTTEIWIPPR